MTKWRGLVSIPKTAGLFYPAVLRSQFLLVWLQKMPPADRSVISRVRTRLSECGTVAHTLLLDAIIQAPYSVKPSWPAYVTHRTAGMAEKVTMLSAYGSEQGTIWLFYFRSSSTMAKSAFSPASIVTDRLYTNARPQSGLQFGQISIPDSLHLVL
jgi:hypothetical protein